MASVLSFPRRKTLKETASDSVQLLVILAVVFGAAGALAVVWMSSSMRNAAVAAALAVSFLGAFVSGNPRLYCFWGFVLTAPLTLSKRFGPMFVGKPGGEDSFRLEISDIFLLVLVAYLAWELLTGIRKGIRIPKVTFVWLLLMAIGCVWIIFGEWRLTAAHEVFRMFKVMVLFLVITNQLERPALLWHAGAALTAGALIEAAIGLTEYWMKDIIGLEFLGETTTSTINVLGATSVQGEAVFRPGGLMQHANILGIFLAVAIPFAVGLLMTSKRNISRIFFIVVLAVAMPAEVITLSRSAWVSAAVSLTLLCIFMFLHPTLRWRSVVTCSVAALIGIVVLIAMFGPITQRLLRSKSDATTAREIYKADARRMIAASPWVGVGLNSYAFALQDYASMRLSSYGETPPTVHNIFYLWWAETGIAGMLLFCAVWGSLIWTGLSNLTVRNETLFAINAACVAAMIAFIPDSFLSFTLRVNSMVRVFWILGGMIFAVRYLRIQEQRTLSAPVIVEAHAPPEPS